MHAVRYLPLASNSSNPHLKLLLCPLNFIIQVTKIDLFHFTSVTSERLNIVLIMLRLKLLIKLVKDVDCVQLALDLLHL